MLRSDVFRSVLLGLCLVAPVGCGSMRASRSVRSAGYPVQQTGVKREMGKKTVYVYIGRPVTEEERQDITIRVLGAVPNATEVVVYPLPGTNAPAQPSDVAPRPNQSGGQAGVAPVDPRPATPPADPADPGAGAPPAATPPATTPPPADPQAPTTDPATQPRPNTPQLGRS